MAERLDAAAQAVPALLPYAPRPAHRLRRARRPRGAGQATWTAQRIHGDLHLGQCLRSPDGEWSLIDFEGEPASPLAERRLPQPPVRDVAGMLRSFDYAARSHDALGARVGGALPGRVLRGLRGGRRLRPAHGPGLLRAYETDKAVYEVLYEARHRPDWLPVPMAAIDASADGRPLTTPQAIT